MRLRAFGCYPRAFASEDDLLASLPELRPGAVILSCRVAGEQALQFLGKLRELGIEWPVIIIADDVGVQQAIGLMRAGALDIVLKDRKQGVLSGAIESSFQELARVSAITAREEAARKRLSALSPREIEVLRALLEETTNKKVAESLGLSVRTVESHRKNLLDQLGVATLLDAFRLALVAGLCPLERDAA